MIWPIFPLQISLYSCPAPNCSTLLVITEKGLVFTRITLLRVSSSFHLITTNCQLVLIRLIISLTPPLLMTLLAQTPLGSLSLSLTTLSSTVGVFFSLSSVWKSCFKHFITCFRFIISAVVFLQICNKEIINDSDFNRRIYDEWKLIHGFIRFFWHVINSSWISVLGSNRKNPNDEVVAYLTICFIQLTASSRSSSLLLLGSILYFFLVFLVAQLFMAVVSGSCRLIVGELLLPFLLLSSFILKVCKLIFDLSHLLHPRKQLENFRIRTLTR